MNSVKSLLLWEKIKEIICSKKTQVTACLIMAHSASYGQSDLIPQELKSTAETILSYIKGDIAVILLSIFFVCSAVAYGFHKESQKAKTAFIAVCVACFVVALAPAIVEKFVKMGK